jgi:sugar phosphate isomerase/epimerase
MARAMDRPLSERLALHTWTLDTTPLAAVLRVARETGWNAVELRHADFARCREAGIGEKETIELVRASGIPVALIGTEYGWIFAKGREFARLMGELERTCARAVALGCDTIMSAQGPVTGSLREAAANLRTAGEIVRAYGLRLAYEFSSASTVVINRLELARELLARAEHPSCGLVLDAYHLERSGRGGRGFEEVPVEQIFAFQYSDVPPTPAPPERAPADRLAPGAGIVRWREVFGLLAEKGYPGYLSYEAPNPAHWARAPHEVALEGVRATRTLLGQAGAAVR